MSHHSYASDSPKEGDLKVWWIPQVPGKPFEVPVSSVEEARKLLEVLAQYDAFQFVNNIKPDYCNAGGLVIYEIERVDGMDQRGDWVDWCDEWGDDIDHAPGGRLHDPDPSATGGSISTGEKS